MKNHTYIALFLGVLICWLLAVVLLGFGRAGNGSLLPLSHAEARANLDRLQNMDASQYRMFFRNQEQFYDMPAEDRDRLRAFFAAVHADPDRERLEQILAAYRLWTVSLPRQDRLDLDAQKNPKLTNEQRLEKIQAIMDRQRGSTAVTTLPQWSLFTPTIGPEPTDRELAEFWEQMPVSQKNAMLTMLPEQMIEILKREYQQSRRPLRPQRPRPPQ